MVPGQDGTIEEQFGSDVGEGSGGSAVESIVVELLSERALDLGEPGVGVKRVIARMVEGDPASKVVVGRGAQEPDPTHSGDVGQRGTEPEGRPVAFQPFGDDDVTGQVHGRAETATTGGRPTDPIR